MLFSEDGAVKVESEPYEQLPRSSLPVKLADSPVSRHNVMLYHKTTNRKIYDAHEVDGSKYFDTLLWNTDGELTEFTRGNLVMEKSGGLWTPPLRCGLLSGTLRADLLASGRIEELVIRKDDLAGATQVWFINSVRGWVPVHLGS